MKVLELFAGERCIGRAFEKRGHKVFSVDWDSKHKNIDLYADISKISAKDILKKFGRPDVVWASPDCTSYSVAAISHHRKLNKLTGSLDPVSDYAKFCDSTNIHLLKIIKELSPIFLFYRKSSWRIAQDVFYARFATLYCDILQVWRRAAKTNRYFHKSSEA